MVIGGLFIGLGLGFIGWCIEYGLCAIAKAIKESDEKR